MYTLWCPHDRLSRDCAVAVADGCGHCADAGRASLDHGGRTAPAAATADLMRGCHPGPTGHAAPISARRTRSRPTNAITARVGGCSHKSYDTGN